MEAAVRVDRLDEVSAHAERFRHWAEQSRNPLGLALLARCRGLIDEEDAERHFAQAIELAPVLSSFDRGRSELRTASGFAVTVAAPTRDRTCGLRSVVSSKSALGRGGARSFGAARQR